jgi:hypothetical protein
MPKRSTYHVIDFGEWIRPRMRDFREQCCDCGLIHRLDFRIVDAAKGRSQHKPAKTGVSALTSSPKTKGRSRPSSRTKPRSRPPPRLHVEFRTRRDDRATAAARRPFRFTPEE